MATTAQGTSSTVSRLGPPLCPATSRFSEVQASFAVALPKRHQVAGFGIADLDDHVIAEGKGSRGVAVVPAGVLAPGDLRAAFDAEAVVEVELPQRIAIEIPGAKLAVAAECEQPTGSRVVLGGGGDALEVALITDGMPSVGGSGVGFFPGGPSGFKVDTAEGVLILLPADQENAISDHHWRGAAVADISSPGRCFFQPGSTIFRIPTRILRGDTGSLWPAPVRPVLRVEVDRRRHERSSTNKVSQQPGPDRSGAMPPP